MVYRSVSIGSQNLSFDVRDTVGLVPGAKFFEDVCRPHVGGYSRPWQVPGKQFLSGINSATQKASVLSLLQERLCGLGVQNKISETDTQNECGTQVSHIYLICLSTFTVSNDCYLELESSNACHYLKVTE